MESCKVCGSKDLRFVKYVIANGRIQIRKQCFNCGVVEMLNYKQALFNLDELPFLDKELKEKFTKKVVSRSKLKKEMFNNNESYYREVYLKSEDWKAKRDSIIERDLGVCRSCGDKAKDVHHITYIRVYKERKNDLISLCRICHTETHKGNKNIKIEFNNKLITLCDANVCQNCNEIFNSENKTNQCGCNN